MQMRVEVPRTAPVVLFSRVKLNGLSVGFRSRRQWVRLPSRAPSWVSSTEERLSYKQATRVRLLHPAPNSLSRDSSVGRARSIIARPWVQLPLPGPSLSGRRQAVRHQASNLAVRGFESHRPLHLNDRAASFVGPRIENSASSRTA
jgi:hypothetical protein